MDNLLTFNLRVPVGVQVVSHLISENTIMEQFLLILSSSLGGCRYERYRKEIESFTNGSLQGLGRLEIQSALALFAGKVADQILADFVPEMSILTGKTLPSANLPGIDPGRASTAPSSSSPEEPLTEPEPVSEPSPEAETKQHLNDFATKNLAGFPQFDEDTVEQITSQAAANIQDIAAKSKIPDEEVSKAAQLAFYDFTILYDDSGSMTTEEVRISSTKQTIQGLYKTAKALNPNRQFSVRSFEGNDYNNLTTEQELSDVIDHMVFNTGASVAQPLQRKILEPLAQEASAGNLNPTVVVIVTDGDLGSNMPDFSNTLTNFKAQLNAAKNTGPAVLFILYRVGNDQSSMESLRNLPVTAGVKDLMLYSEDTIDSKLASVGGDTDAFVGMIISDLIKAMDLQAIQ